MSAPPPFDYDGNPREETSPGNTKSSKRGAETIDLSRLFHEDLSSSGTFNLAGVESTALGRLLQALPIPAVVIEKSGHVVFLNRYCEKVSPDYHKVHGSHFTALLPDETAARQAESVIKRVFSTRSEQVVEGRLVLGEKRVLVRFHFQAIRLGKEKLILGLAEDLTAERERLSLTEKLRDRLEKSVAERTEELQKANEKLEEEIAQRGRMENQLRQLQRLQAIGTLAGGIAHDFNNILYAIIGYAELAQDRVGEEGPLRNDLSEIVRAGLRAKELVNQILMFSRQSKLEMKALDVAPILKETLKFIRASMPSTIEIRHSFEADTGTILADPTQVHQVFMNLCANAGHAMREQGGVLDVSLSSEVLDASFDPQIPHKGPKPYVKLTVTDTGHGMPPEVLERIFEPYYTTRPQGEGTGLGLAVVHGIVHSHGGIIRAASKVGQGSVFEVYFPLIGKKTTRRVAGKEVLPTGSERILLVDDEPAIVRMAEAMLRNLGYRVVSCINGMEALELFSKDPNAVDLVMTDLTMPKMTGAELCRQLIRLRADIPIILCTGFSESMTEEQAAELGVRAFIHKPISKLQIAAGIRQVLDQRKEQEK